ncbi:hypothetical protein, partial [Armatimonas sp.]|uniref:hypothetical protein n=1 Tax=Armatimonas sp. TaxID=1872638 RepID=UPI0037516C0A
PPAINPEIPVIKIFIEAFSRIPFDGLKGHLWAALRAKRAEPAERETFDAASGRLAKPLRRGLSGLGKPFVKKPP